MRRKPFQHFGVFCRPAWVASEALPDGAFGQPSVFDMIKVLGGQKNPHKMWQRLTGTHPEVLTKCQNLQFPGPGQRETPVARDKIQKADPDVLAKCEDFLFPGQGQKAAPIARTKEDAYYILGLLPGAVGKKYREALCTKTGIPVSSLCLSQGPA